MRFVSFELKLVYRQGSELNGILRRFSSWHSVLGNGLQNLKDLIAVVSLTQEGQGKGTRHDKIGTVYGWSL